MISLVIPFVGSVMVVVSIKNVSTLKSLSSYFVHALICQS